MTAIVLIPLMRGHPPHARRPAGGGRRLSERVGGASTLGGGGRGEAWCERTAVDVAFRGPRYQTAPSTTAAASTAYAQFRFEETHANPAPVYWG
jgi:hypothetical protein